jgi:hypothetical protein
VEGFIYYVLQTFWFRFLVDAKLWEKEKAERGGDGGQSRR